MKTLLCCIIIFGLAYLAGNTRADGQKQMPSKKAIIHSKKSHHVQNH